MTNWIQRILNRLGLPVGASLSADIAAIPTTPALQAIWTNALATALANYTAARAAFLENIDNANLATIGDISSLDATKIGYLSQLDFALQEAIAAIPTVMVGTDGAALASAWTAALATVLGNYTAVRAGYLDQLDFALQEAIAALQTDLDNPDQYKANVAALGLEATLTAIKGGGWSDETLVAIKAAIDTISGVNTYQEQIPDTDFNLAAIDVDLTADPPNADAENSVVDIDANAGDTFVLRSLFVNITAFGDGSKLTFKLWVPVNGTITMVDSVDISATGIQNLMDIFGLREVHADSIHITVQVDVGATGACSGTWKYAKAS